MAEAQFCGVPGVELPREACRCEIEIAKAVAIDLRQSFDEFKGRTVELVAQDWSSIRALADCFTDSDQIAGVLATQVIRGLARDAPTYDARFFLKDASGRVRHESGARVRHRCGAR